MPPVTPTRYGPSFRFTLMTDEPTLAAAADAAGVERIGLDLERVGKLARQGHLPNVRISDHRIEQLPPLRACLTRARTFLRCNPLHAGSAGEVEQALAFGGEILMLPFFHGAAEVEQFVKLVGGRAVVSLLVETAAAAAAVGEIARIPGVDEIMVGLNDLHRELGFRNAFALLASPTMGRVAAEVHEVGLPFGFGGLADPANGALPVPPGLVHAQYPRLGASGAFVARRFGAAGLRAEDLRAGIERCRAELDRWSACGRDALEAAREELERAAARR